MRLHRAQRSTRRTVSQAAKALILSTDVQVIATNGLEARFLFEEIYVRRCYLNERVALSPGDTVLDIGGNIGIFALWASERVQPAGHVVSVEALPPTFKILTQNVLRLSPAAATAAPGPAKDSRPHGWRSKLHAARRVVGKRLAQMLSHAQLSKQANADARQRSAIVRGHGATSDVQITAVNCAAACRDSGDVQMTYFPRATGWGTADAGTHAERMQQALPAFVRHAAHDRRSVLFNTLGMRFFRFVERWARFLVAPLLNLHCRFMLARREQFSVPQRTVSSLLRELDIEHVDLLKVDTEGAEVEVLKGLDARAWKQIKQLVVEVHSADLLREVRALVEPHFARVAVEKDASLGESELYLLYATP